MVDERVTHFDGEQRQEHRLCTNDFPSSRTPNGKRTKFTPDGSICTEKLNDRLFMLCEMYYRCIVNAAMEEQCIKQPIEPKTFCGSTTPLESKRESQQEESDVIFAKTWSFDSSSYDQSMLIQSCVDDPSCQPKQLCQKALTFKFENPHFIYRQIQREWKHLENFMKSCLHLFSQDKPKSQELICRVPPCTYNYYEHTSTRLHAKSCQNSQTHFSHKTWLLWKKKKKEKEKQTFLSSLKDNTRSSLEYVRNILDLVSFTMDLLDDATMSLDTIQDEMLEWLKKIEQVSDRLLEKLRHVYTQICVFAIIFCLFNEFPNGIRHLCTTMPWTIWPALVVLWGVCWMFHSGPVPCAVAEVERTLPLEHQEQLLDSQGEFYYSNNPSSAADFETDDWLRNDKGFNLSTIASFDNTIDIAEFSWNPWPDSAGVTYNWGCVDQLSQIDEAAASSIIHAISPTTSSLLATIPNRNEHLDTSRFTAEDLSRKSPLCLLDFPQQSPSEANLMKQTICTSIQANRLNLPDF
jgi:hypothetical protein